MVKNENDLLGLLIKNMNSEHICDQSKCLKDSGIDSNSFIIMSKSLINKGYVTSTMDTYSLTTIGINSYVSYKKAFLIKISSILKLTLREFVAYALGALSGLTVAYIVHMLNW